MQSLGDTMSFYIAKYNKETGTFTLQMDKDRPQQFYSLEDAITSYKLAFFAEGHNNVLLLESVALDVDVAVEEHKSKMVIKP